MFSIFTSRHRFLVALLFSVLSSIAANWAMASDAAELDDFERLVEINDRFESLYDRVNGLEHPVKRMVLMRMQVAAKSHTNFLHEMAARAIRNRGASPDPRLATLLSGEPELIRSMLQMHTENIKLPLGDESAAELAAIDANLKAMLSETGILYNSLMTNLSLSRDLGLDVVEEERQLKRATRERAANVSSYLALAWLDVKAMKERAALLPSDGEVQSLYIVQAELMATVSRELQVVIQALQSLGLRTSAYDAQLIAATGSISSDLFSVSVFMGLLNTWLDAASRWFRINGGNLVFDFFMFAIIVVLSRILSRWVQRGAETAVRLSKANISTLLRRMIVSGASTSVYVVGVLIALSQVGISLGPLLTGLGIAGFIVGFALQDTLSNFASGMMILFYRPFDVGDVIDSDGIFGEVNYMSLVSTTILTFDNQTLIVPNTKIWSNVIKNVTAQKERRVDLVFGISYGDDIPKAEAVLTAILDDYPSVLPEPKPLIKVHELGESSVNIIVRPWVKTKDYWNTYWDLTRIVKLKFDEEGISFPFPQRDVHHYGRDDTPYPE